ncbi:hypothetical protein BGX31_002922 [Mortierella sp. GBA43]|nr:hypothetical protein BGX31_002922 [Mortierella sp. GBA43]
MRKTWSIRLALSLSFLKTYLRHADHLSIEECQHRSRSIPFMTAPAGIRINKVKIPAFPYRSKAEAIVYDCLSEEERELLSSSFRNHDRMETEDYEEDQFAEGLDAEWLEYIGPEDTTTDIPSENSPGAVLYFHGGGYYTGSKEEHRVLIGPLVKRLGKNVRILIINYRLAPQNPFPAALVDALSSYMWLMDQSISESFSLGNGPSDGDRRSLDDLFQPNQIVFMGDSAGGGLALSLSLLLRDHGSLPQPLSLVTWSPWLDLTQSLPSFKENALTDCIPYEGFVHRHSEAVDKMFEDEPAGSQVRQRAQVYCPDSCLRIKYVSPLYETDFKGIPSVFITCGSAERFANECVLMASRLEEQQQPCRIDIHEDMPHIFPLFRFHPSASTALDRTSAYIRETIAMGSTLSNFGNEVIIPISSTSSSLSCSAAQSPLLPSRPVERFHPDSGLGMDDGPALNPAHDNTNRSPYIDQVDSASSISLVPSESSSSTLGSPSPESTKSPLSQSRSDNKGGRTGELVGSSEPTSVRDTAPRKAIVNVIDLSGSSVMSYHKQTRYQPCRGASYMDVTQRRYHRPQALTLQDVVSDATLYEWEILLRQGYTPTRHWPHARGVY